MASRLVSNGRFRSALRHLPEVSRAEIASGLDRTARAIQSTAIALAPLDTGRLRRALAAKGAIGRRRKGLEVEFGFRTKSLQKKAFYAPFVEFGTKAYAKGDFRFRGVSDGGRYRKMRVAVPARRAQPFFRPAVAANMNLWRREMRAALQRALRRAARG